MITDYKGPSNSRGVFAFMVGETIIGTFQEGESTVLVLSSGGGFELTPQGAFWAVSREMLAARWKAQQDKLLAAMKALGTDPTAPTVESK